MTQSGWRSGGFAYVVSVNPQMIINRYPDIRLKAAVKEELLFTGRFARNLVRNRFRTRNILFYPYIPDPRAGAYKSARRLGYNITNNPRLGFDRVFAWHDITIRPEHPLLHELARDHWVVNLHCRDISKRHVEAVFSQVFGYSSLVDPTTYEGLCVCKNDSNAIADKELVRCPIKDPKPGYVYQILLENLTPRGLRDQRLCIYNGEISFMMLRHKPLESRLTRTRTVEVAEVADHLSPEEVTNVLRFCSLLGLDYGELDTIRSSVDGRLYIHDANNTHWARMDTFEVSPRDQALWVEKADAAFRDRILLAERRQAHLAAEPTEGAWIR